MLCHPFLDSDNGDDDDSSIISWHDDDWYVERQGDWSKVSKVSVLLVCYTAYLFIPTFRNNVWVLSSSNGRCPRNVGSKPATYVTPNHRTSMNSPAPRRKSAFPPWSIGHYRCVCVICGVRTACPANEVKLRLVRRALRNSTAAFTLLQFYPKLLRLTEYETESAPGTKRPKIKKEGKDTKLTGVIWAAEWVSVLQYDERFTTETH